jgi:hypothetical protein
VSGNSNQRGHHTDQYDHQSAEGDGELGAKKIHLVIQPRLEGAHVFRKDFPYVREVRFRGDAQVVDIHSGGGAQVVDICLGGHTQVVDICLGGDLVHHLPLQGVDDGFGLFVGHFDAHESIIQRINHAHCESFLTSTGRHPERLRSCRTAE